MAKQTIRPAVALAMAATLLFCSLPSNASAKRTRPSGSSGASSTQRGVSGSATVTRSRGSGRASGRATYGYGGHHYGYGYGYGHHHHPYYWYLGYPGFYYWRWGWPYLAVTYSVLNDRSAPGIVETDIKPKRAEVLVDDQVVGEARDFNGTWDLLYLKPGLRSVRFRAPGHLTLTLWLDIEPASYFRIKERLAEGEGRDPRSIEKPEVPEKVEVEVEAATERPAADEALPQGLLRIEASPVDAAIYLDGEFLARADELDRLHGALPVALGRHVIEVVRPGYVGERLEIVAERDKPQKVRIDLDRKEKAAGL